MRKWIWMFAFLASSAFAAGDEAKELDRLHAALSMLNQEEQSLFQQFQMVQDMLKSNGQTLYGMQVQPMRNMGDVPNYSEAIEAQKKVIRRRDSLYDEAESLLKRYGEVEEKKKPLLERIYTLTLAK